MILKIRIGKHRLTLTFSPVTDVIGVNSKLPDGTHILMWDWDNKTLEAVIAGLNEIQIKYRLPKIYILETKPNENFMAYCFKRVSWQLAKEIIAATPNICENYYKWGVFRRHFTLRVSPKCGRVPKLVAILSSPVPEDVSVAELRSWVQYETMPDKYKPHYIKLGERQWRTNE